MDYKDYYQILDIDRSATQDAVKTAYRKLARKYHPDINREAGAEDKFKELGEAYEVLKDTKKRAAYDQLGAEWKSGQNFEAPPQWDTGFKHSGRRDGADRAEFSDFFETLFRREQGDPQQGKQHYEFHAQGEDHHAKIEIALTDSYAGATRSLSLSSPQLDANGHVTVKSRSINVKIPKGVVEGQHIRLAGQGAPGAGKGQSGDLYLEVQFAKDPIYRVIGTDVYLDLPISPWEAALGSKIKIPTPIGNVEMSIPKNSRSGQKLRLKKRGIPAKAPGDLFAVLQIVVPAAKSEKDTELYTQMSRQMKFNPRERLGV
jgi:curved DNA-binding protein